MIIRRPLAPVLLASFLLASELVLAAVLVRLLRTSVPLRSPGPCLVGLATFVSAWAALAWPVAALALELASRRHGASPDPPSDSARPPPCAGRTLSSLAGLASIGLLVAIGCAAVVASLGLSALVSFKRGLLRGDLPAALGVPVVLLAPAGILLCLFVGAGSLACARIAAGEREALTPGDGLFALSEELVVILAAPLRTLLLAAGLAVFGAPLSATALLLGTAALSPGSVPVRVVMLGAHGLCSAAAFLWAASALRLGLEPRLPAPPPAELPASDAAPQGSQSPPELLE